MSTTTNELQVTMLYTDFSTRNYGLDVATGMTPNQMKNNVRQFNAALAADSVNAIYQTFVSDNGAPPVRISAAKMITRVEEVIYGG